MQCSAKVMKEKEIRYKIKYEFKTIYFKILKEGWGYGSVVEHLLSICDTPGSVFSFVKNKNTETVTQGILLRCHKQNTWGKCRQFEKGEMQAHLLSLTLIKVAFWIQFMLWNMLIKGESIWLQNCKTALWVLLNICNVFNAFLFY